MKLNVIAVKRKQITKNNVEDLLNPLGLKIDRKIFIKPNLSIPAGKSSGVVTDVQLVGHIVDYLRDRGAGDIWIGEGPVIGYDTMNIFRSTGYEDLAREKGISLIDLNTAERKSVRWHYGEIALPAIALNSFYINIAKLKTHVQTTVTFSVKNQKGLLLPADKKRFHRDWGLHWPIAYLAEAVKPSLSIIDGFVGLEGDGPSNFGKPRKLGILAAGTDMIALDSLCCRMVSIDPEKVLHLKYAEGIGVGNMISENDQILSTMPESRHYTLQKANENFRKMGRLYAIRNTNTCSSCGDAIYNAIKMVGVTPKFWPRLFTIVAYRVLIGGMVLVTGRDASLRGIRGKVICIGECTKSLAEQSGFCFVAGCPPVPREIAEVMLR